MDPQLKRQCTSVVYVARVIDRDGHGDPRYDRFPAKFSARVEKLNSIKNSSGDGGGMVTEETNTRIITEDEIQISDRVWLPNADYRDINEGDTPKKVEMYRTELGEIDYWETYV
tara:strand:- start:2957 stop:3298 length:342 start_codon:yes stop_codon:yes gene_type:complete